MPLTQANCLAVGTWYVAEIRRRIKVRQEAAERMKSQPDERGAKIRAAGEAAAKAHRLGALLSAKVEDHERDPVTGSYGQALRLVSVDGHSLQIPLRLLPKLSAALDDMKAPHGLARSACQEAEFLTTMLGNSPIAGFQSYVSKLHAVPGTLPAPADLGRLLDDYLTARRPVTCKIA